MAYMTVGNQDRVLILGVGNLLWADEGFGVRCVEAFGSGYGVPGNVSIVDGGTQGLYLVDLFREHSHIIVFDCIDFGDEPGAMRVVRDSDVPSFIAQRKMSLHQTGLQDVIATAQLMGAEFKSLVLIGVQPVELDDWGGSLRPAVRMMVPVAVETAAAQLRLWGVRLERRADKATVVAQVGTAELTIDRYETQRPAPELASRLGDDRVLNRYGLPEVLPEAVGLVAANDVALSATAAE
jgi:hydrogenase maturation protease